MAYTNLADVIVPTVYADAVNYELTLPVNRILSSPALVNDSVLNATLSGGFGQEGNSILINSFNAWAAVDIVGSDDETDTIATNSRTEYSQKATKLVRNFSFDAAQLARQFAAGDPMSDAVTSAAKNVLDNRQTAVVNTVTGVFADNVANDSSDMVTSIKIASAVTPVAANMISRSTILDAMAQRGDLATLPSVIIMHSAVFFQLMQDDTTSFERESAQGLTYTYIGIPVVVDDTVATVTENSAVTYTTYIMWPNSLRFGSTGVSSVIFDDPQAGNGSGVTSLITRRIDIIHPEGFDYTGTDNGTNANLAAAASWNRVVDDRKRVGISFIESNV